MSPPKDAYYFCPSCRFIWETKGRATACHRCMARSVKKLSIDQMEDALERGFAGLCVPCGHIHSTALPPTNFPKETT